MYSDVKGLIVIQTTYTRAAMDLKQILHNHVFAPPAVRAPWWEPIARFVSRHWPKSIMPAHVSRVAVLVTLFCVVLAALLVAAWRRGWLYRRRVVRHSNSDTAAHKDLSLIAAADAFNHDAYNVMLGYLVDYCVQFAAKRGLVSARPWKTARMYIGEVGRFDSDDFTRVFRAVMEAREATLFALRPLSRQVAQELLGQVHAVVIGVQS